MGDKNTKMVTVRVKKELHDEFKKVMIRKGSTISENIIEHIKKQTQNYEFKTGKNDYDNTEFKKINIIIDIDDYKEYKIKMIEESTTPTADIIRHMQYTVDQSKNN